MKINLTDKKSKEESIVFILNDLSSIKQCMLNKEEATFVSEQFKKHKKHNFSFNKYTHFVIIVIVKEENTVYKKLESLRKQGDKVGKFLLRHNQNSININGLSAESATIKAFSEGLILGNYKFLKYKSNKDSEAIKSINITGKNITKSDILELKAITEGVYHCRDLINTPFRDMKAMDFADNILKLCNPLGIKTEVFNKSQLSALKMAGIIAVNSGSSTEPAFIKLEWCPESKKNKKPIVLVGKGLVFDTGGISLKPASGMEEMKSDMAGGAAVFGAIYAIAKAKLPVHIIGLIPATDNQPGNNAMIPGDVITMSNNVTVEIINTDAEGRLILADALCYASKYKPSLVIDIATLTGSAERAIGKHGMVAMESNANKQLADLEESGLETYERIAKMPFWDEYDKEIESDIADIQNIGKSNNAGAITAGKFLSRFIDYPWIHLDIAGVAYMSQKESYKGKGGTGVGVRLLFNFAKKITEKTNKK